MRVLHLVAANLIVYWSTFEANWKLLVAIAFGLVLFGVTYMLTSPDKRPDLDLKGWTWVPPWLVGMTVIGYLGRYGTTAQKILPEWVDLAVGRRINLTIFYWAVVLAVDNDEVRQLVDAEEEEIKAQPDLNV